MIILGCFDLKSRQRSKLSGLCRCTWQYLVSSSGRYILFLVLERLFFCVHVILNTMVNLSPVVVQNYKSLQHRFLFWPCFFSGQILIYPSHNFEVILPLYLVIQQVSPLKYKVYIFLSSSRPVFFFNWFVFLALVVFLLSLQVCPVPVSYTHLRAHET